MKRAAFILLVWAGALTPQNYTKKGEFVLPPDYRNWDFLSSSIGMNYPEAGAPSRSPAFDNVLVNPKAHQAFLKTGLWPDKTVLLLEVRAADTGPGLDRNSRFQTGVIAIEAHVKDASRGGWMFYSIDKNSSNGRPIEKTANCYSCHEKKAAVDTTFVQYYPTLINTAKQHGTYRVSAE